MVQQTTPPRTKSRSQLHFFLENEEEESQGEISQGSSSPNTSLNPTHAGLRGYKARTGGRIPTDHQVDAAGLWCFQSRHGGQTLYWDAAVCKDTQDAGGVEHTAHGLAASVVEVSVNHFPVQ